jgi:hypothetical protein
MIEKRIFVVDSNGVTKEKKVQVLDENKKSKDGFTVDEDGNASKTDNKPEWKRKLEDVTGEIKSKK